MAVIIPSAGFFFFFFFLVSSTVVGNIGVIDGVKFYTSSFSLNHRTGF